MVYMVTFTINILYAPNVSIPYMDPMGEGNLFIGTFKSPFCWGPVRKSINLQHGSRQHGLMRKHFSRVDLDQNCIENEMA